jgi:hypothetical protein
VVGSMSGFCPTYDDEQIGRHPSAMRFNVVETLLGDHLDLHVRA